LLSIEETTGVRQASFNYSGDQSVSRSFMAPPTTESAGRLWMIYRRQTGVLEGLIADGTGLHSIGQVGHLAIADTAPFTLLLTSDATGVGNSMTVSFDDFLARGVTEAKAAVKRRCWMLYR
jgi:hypothetical protein